MGSRDFICLIALTLCGCDDAPRRAEPPPEPTVTAYHADPATGRIAANHTDARGTTTLQSGDDVAVILPPPFTPPPGAELSNVVRVARNDEVLVTHFNYVSPRPPGEVIAFYHAQAQVAGIIPSVALNGKVRTLGGQNRAGTREFVVTARGEGGGSAGQVMVTRSR